MGIFKAYVIRGLVPPELDADLARKIGHAFARFLEAKRLVVGQDMRSHSPLIADAVVDGMRDAGCDRIEGAHAQMIRVSGLEIACRIPRG